MSSLVRKMQRRLKRGKGDSKGIRLVGFTNPVVKQASACRGSRRGKHREGFSVREEV